MPVYKDAWISQMQHSLYKKTKQNREQGTVYDYRGCTVTENCSRQIGAGGGAKCKIIHAMISFMLGGKQLYVSVLNALFKIYKET